MSTSLKLELVGHSQNWSRLREMIANERVPCSLIFSGPEGVGKLHFARAFVQVLFCEVRLQRLMAEGESGVTEACGECGACLRVSQGQHESLLEFSVEKAPLKIKEAQEIKDFLSLRSLSSHRVCLIDQADEMTAQAANALLKVIEEPPPKTHFILISSRPSLILQTLRSRSQNCSFGPLTPDEILQIRSVPTWVANSCGGSLSFASRLDGEELQNLRRQIQSFLGTLVGEPEFGFDADSELASALRNKNQSEMASWLLKQFLRDAMVYPVSPSLVRDPDSQELIEKLSQCRADELGLAFDSVIQFEKDVSANVDRLLAFEYLHRHLRSYLRPAAGSSEMSV